MIQGPLRYYGRGACKHNAGQPPAETIDNASGLSHGVINNNAGVV